MPTVRPVRLTPLPATNSWQVVSLENLKKQVQVSAVVGQHDDDLLLRLRAVELEVERDLGLSFFRSTFRQIAASFPDRGAPLTLQIGNADQVDSIEYWDSAGIWQQLEAELYQFSLDFTRPLIFPTNSWPATARRHDAVRVLFEAGYEKRDQVPEHYREMLRAKVHAHFARGTDEAVRMMEVYEMLRTGNHHTYASGS